MIIETVKTGSFSMDFFKFGQGEETLVILPGLSVQSVTVYADSIAEAYSIIAKNYTVYVFDRRKELPDSYSVRDMARDTTDVLLTLGLDRIDLFGASQGGMIAMQIAIEHPQLIKKLILGSTTARMEETEYRTVEEWIRFAKAGEKEKLYLVFGEAVYPQGLFEMLKKPLIKASETVTDEDLTRFIILAEGMKTFDVSNELQKISCPVLVINSLDDSVVGSDAGVQLAKHLKDQKGVVLFMYKGYGHAAYDTAPDYKERLLYFLNKREMK